MMENLHSISSRPIAGPASSGFGVRQGKSTEPKKQGDILDLSPEAEAQLRKLKQRDAEVRAHEKAHMAAAGGSAVGGPRYEYQKGPDGKQYAIGGHVDISLSSVDGNPEENEKNAREARRAALAPGQPSSQDRAVAARAASMEAEAKTEKLEEKSRERKEDEESDWDRKAAEQKTWENAFANAAEGNAQAGQEMDSALMRKAIGIYNEAAQAGMAEAPFAGAAHGLAIAV